MLEAIRHGRSIACSQRRCEELQKREAEREAEANALRKRAAELSAEIKSYMDRESDLVAEIKKLRERESELSAELESLRQQQNDHSDANKNPRQGHQAPTCCERLEAGLNQQEESSVEIAFGSRSLPRVGRTTCPGRRLEAAERRRGMRRAPSRTAGVARNRRFRDWNRNSPKRKNSFRVAEAAVRVEGAGGNCEDSNRLYEMAMDDVRELKAKNAELQQQLAKAPSGGGGGSSARERAATFWIGKRRRNAFSRRWNRITTTRSRKPERLEIEDIIRKTDAIIAEKNREIEELKMLLENQSNNLGNVAVGAAALGQMFDQDAIVREERENLKRIQDEWREKLRLAEVEISVERAKLARDKSQLEERLRQMEQLGVSPTAMPQESKTPDQAFPRQMAGKTGLQGWGKREVGWDKPRRFTHHRLISQINCRRSSRGDLTHSARIFAITRSAALRCRPVGRKP